MTEDIKKYLEKEGLSAISSISENILFARFVMGYVNAEMRDYYEGYRKVGWVAVHDALQYDGYAVVKRIPDFHGPYTDSLGIAIKKISEDGYKVAIEHGKDEITDMRDMFLCHEWFKVTVSKGKKAFTKKAVHIGAALIAASIQAYTGYDIQKYKKPDAK